MSAQPKLKHTLEEYLELDRNSEARLEYRDGEIFDMSGSSPQHDQVEGNVYYNLRTKLQGRGCRVFLANTRIKVPSAPPYRYGDTSAVCGQPQFEAIGGVEALTNPALIIEVLSKSTEGYDRGDKFTHYQSIPNFREYLLVAQHRPHVTHLVKQADGSWNQREYNELDAVVKLVSLECDLSLREIYEAVSFTPAEPPPLIRPLI
ncbi:MAG: Uma2 family endonuclease [Acidobacteriota bacterium]|nr:Uma2 family endonuclease [Acidobacteriota bacterium]